MSERPNSAPAVWKQNGATHNHAAELWPLLEALLRKWHWPVIGGVFLALLGLAAGFVIWKNSYTAPAQLIRYESSNAEEVFGMRQAADQTLPTILQSPELLQEVAGRVNPPIASGSLAAGLHVMPQHNSDIIVVTVTGKNREATQNLVNLYAREAVRYTQDMQAKAAEEICQFTTQQLTQVESEIAVANRQMQEISPAGATNLAGAAPRPATLREKIQSARDDLAGLLGQYTDAHPLVQAKRAEIAALENELARQPAGGTGAATSLAPATSSDPEILRGKLQVLENARLTLLGRAHAAQALAANPPGYCQLLAAATTNDVVKHSRLVKVGFLGAFFGLLGTVGVAAVILLLEVMDDHLKNPADIRRVTQLPILAQAGDLEALSPAQRDQWAFRAWTGLQGRLSASANHGLVCGITSASHGEGRSTWINLLAHVANQQGFRVLTIATRPVPRNGETNGAVVETGSPANGTGLTHEDSAALAANALATPAEITQKLMSPEPEPIVHIPLPGWVWNLERRKQWQTALHHWSQIENVVILVELPPASEAEAVLLAENLPNVIWLAASGQAKAGDTREQLETLRQARCKLAGAVLNRSPASLLQKRFQRWLSYAVVLGALNVLSLQAAESPGALAATNSNPAPETNLSFSVVSPAQCADWQKHLTLGAGDVLNLSLYGEPALTQLNVPIGPDGRISYLEAADVPAAGLTVDELRERLDAELAKYRRAPHCIITPVAYNSKKYFLLGSVARPGVFTLDRPTTIIEAVANARGLETVLQNRDLVEIADLPHAFLVRHGKRLPVDFEKLFDRGDLTQNIALEPDDYLFFPPADLKQVYVVGEVTTPGLAPLTGETSALRAIAEQGGFTSRAWKKRILVIRGSLSSPQTFVVDADAVLSARAPDLKLQPGDIVYVHYRPWIKAEEILDLAVTSFIQSATIVYTGLRVGPFITTPIIN